MKSNGRKFQKNSAAFTGLEAAIVLIAFVVVAAVFSYVMLGAGFFTSQKSKEVVHTGVDQATSSIELAGDVIGTGDTTDDLLNGVKISLSLTAGNNPVDLSKMVISYKTKSNYFANVFHPYYVTGDTIPSGSAAGDITFLGDDTNKVVVWTSEVGTSNTLLEKGEKVLLNLEFTEDNLAFAFNADGSELVGPNGKVTLELKPATGATLPISITAPPAIKSIMTLV